MNKLFNTLRGMLVPVQMKDGNVTLGWAALRLEKGKWVQVRPNGTVKLAGDTFQDAVDYFMVAHGRRSPQTTEWDLRYVAQLPEAADLYAKAFGKYPSLAA